MNLKTVAIALTSVIAQAAPSWADQATPAKACAPLCHVDVTTTPERRKAEAVAMSKSDAATQNLCMIACIARNLPDGDIRKPMLKGIAIKTYETAKGQGLDVPRPDLETRDVPAPPER